MSLFCPQGAARCRTLIVEDDADSCEALTRALRRHGYAADFARTLDEAMTKLDQGPQCLVLDLRLPDGNGLQVLRRIHDEALPVRVAVVTGAADGDLLAEAVMLRPDAFFTKPADLAEVLAWLSAASAASTADDAGGGSPPSVSHA